MWAFWTALIFVSALSIYLQHIYFSRLRIFLQGERNKLWAVVVDVPSVFISYRRSDSRPAAFRLASQLRDQHGLRVFIDEIGIESGEEFWPRIQEQLRRADVVLFVIANDWESATLPGSTIPRLLENDDPVRKELDFARRIRVFALPVFVDGRKPPVMAQMPDDVTWILGLNGESMDLGRDFQEHAARLARIVKHHSKSLPPYLRDQAISSDKTAWDSMIKRLSILVGSGIVLAAIIIAVGANLLVATWRQDKQEAEASEKFKEYDNATNKQSENNRKSASEASDAFKRTVDLGKDLAALKGGFQFSLADLGMAEKQFGGKGAVFADWSRTRRVIVDGVADNFAQNQLALVPAKTPTGPSPELKIQLKLPSTPDASLTSICAKCAESKRKVRVVALLRARSINTIMGELEILLPLD